MAGFLMPLAGIASQLGTPAAQGLQDIHTMDQQAVNRAAFGKTLEGLGPDYEYARQMWNSGASPEAVISTMSGPVGQAVAAQHYAEQGAQIFGTDEPIDQKLEKWGQLTGKWDPYLKYQENLLKPHKPSFDEDLAAVRDTLDHSPNLPAGVRALGERAYATRNPELVNQFVHAMPKAFTAGAGDDLTPEQSQALQNDRGYQQFKNQNPGVEAILGKKKAYAQYLKETALTAPEKGQLHQAKQAASMLDSYLSAGLAVLPAQAGWGAAGATLWRHVRHLKGDPAVSRYLQARNGIIAHMRAITGTGRPNQKELEMSSEALQSAATQADLIAAVKEAQTSLQDAERILQSGRIPDDSGQAGGSSEDADDSILQQAR